MNKFLLNVMCLFISGMSVYSSEKPSSSKFVEKIRKAVNKESVEGSMFDVSSSDDELSPSEKVAVGSGGHFNTLRSMIVVRAPRLKPDLSRGKSLEDLFEKFDLPPPVKSNDLLGGVNLPDNQTLLKNKFALER